MTITDLFYGSKCDSCGTIHPIRVLLEFGKYCDYSILCGCRNLYIVQGEEMKEFYEDKATILNGNFIEDIQLEKDSDTNILIVNSLEWKKLEEWGLLYQSTMDLFKWV